MITSTARSGTAGVAVEAGKEALNTSSVSGGAVNNGTGSVNPTDSHESATATKFGDIYKQIQAKYGEKAQKPREIKKSLGKDDFLRIMLTQMKNQDPTNPFKAEQMATEVAQFTSVEQLQNVNQNLNRMSGQNRPLEQMAMTNIIGKVVTIDRERFPHVEGESDELSFNLPKNAKELRVIITNDLGEEIYQRDLGEQKSGRVEFSWDGIKSNTLAAKAGNYRFKVDAKDENGKKIEITSQTQSKVIGVSFEGLEPVFLVGDAKHQDKVTMKNLVRIEVDEGQLQKSAEATEKKEFKISSPNSQSSQPIAPSSNIFTFQKGVGSTSLPSTGSVGPNNSVPYAQNNPNVNHSKVEDTEKGFPNGLSELNEQKTEIQKGGELK